MFPLGRRTAIGSGLMNALVLDDPTVSEIHAEIVEQDGSYILIDRASTNGSYVDEHRAFRNRLQPGARLRFGRVEWTFEVDDAEQGRAQRMA
jgi:pSer/pThr/pTyr-binding forkhead associated (FHA) protein